MYEFILNNIGLIFNLVGTIMVAVSFEPYPAKGAPYTSENGKIKYVAHFNYPKLFYLGLIILIFGFVFQLKF